MRLNIELVRPFKILYLNNLKGFDSIFLKQNGRKSYDIQMQWNFNTKLNLF